MIRDPIEYRPTRLRNVFMLLVCVTFTVTTGAMLFSGNGTTEDRIYGGFGVVLFGFGIGFSAYSLLCPKAVLRLGPDRIEAISPFGKRTLDFPLAQLAETRIVRRGRTTFLALIPLDHDHGLDDAFPKPRRDDRLARALFGSRFMVMPSQYSVRPKALAKEVERVHAALVQKEGEYPRSVAPRR